MTTRAIRPIVCVGHASYDLTFEVPHHPGADEKTVASSFTGCGGGPAANASIAIALDGLASVFIGYLGNDPYGDAHLRELMNAGVICDDVQRGNASTPLSSILVKPGGNRSLVNFRESTPLSAHQPLNLDLSNCAAVLFDGHEPDLSIHLVKECQNAGIPTILDAGSLHRGTEVLANQVDYLIASEKFASQYTQQNNAPVNALKKCRT